MAKGIVLVSSHNGSVPIDGIEAATVAEVAGQLNITLSDVVITVNSDTAFPQTKLHDNDLVALQKAKTKSG